MSKFLIVYRSYGVDGFSTLKSDQCEVVQVKNPNEFPNYALPGYVCCTYDLNKMIELLHKANLLDSCKIDSKMLPIKDAKDERTKNLFSKWGNLLDRLAIAEHNEKVNSKMLPLNNSEYSSDEEYQDMVSKPVVQNDNLDDRLYTSQDIHSSDLAKWLIVNGKDRPWTVDGESELSATISLPCKASVLADYLITHNKTIRLFTPHSRQVDSKEIEFYADFDRNNNMSKIFELAWVQYDEKYNRIMPGERWKIFEFGGKDTKHLSKNLVDMNKVAKGLGIEREQCHDDKKPKDWQENPLRSKISEDYNKLVQANKAYKEKLDKIAKLNKKPTKNLSTEKGRKFWEHVEKVAAGVELYPEWKKTGLNVQQPGIEVKVTKREDMILPAATPEEIPLVKAQMTLAKLLDLEEEYEENRNHSIESRREVDKAIQESRKLVDIEEKKFAEYLLTPTTLDLLLDSAINFLENSSTENRESFSKLYQEHNLVKKPKFSLFLNQDTQQLINSGEYNKKWLGILNGKLLASHDSQNVLISVLKSRHDFGLINIIYLD